MRSKGSLAKGLLVALILTLAPITAFSAQKITPGSTCKVLNQKVVYLKKTYTCTKSGKKFIWNKGVVIKVVVKPTPSQSSEPNSLTRREKALAEIKRVYDSNSSYQPAVKYIFASDAPQNFAEMLKEVIPFASRFWSSEFKPTTEFPIILGSPSSVEWVNDEMKRYGHEIPKWNREFIIKLGENSSRGDVVNNSRGALTYYVIGKEKDKSIKTGNELTMRGFVAHEYVHAVAVSIIGDREKGIPGWSVEGSANFYGFAIAALMAEQPNTAMSKVNTENLRRSYSNQGALVPHSLNKDDLYKAVVTSEKGGGGDGTTCAEPKILCYTAGALFTEVLVADHGHAKFVDWWKLSRKKNWEVAFEEVFGMQIDKWYEEVAIPYVIQESKGAIPEVPAPKSASTFTQHSARLPRPFVDPSNQNQQSTPSPMQTNNEKLIIATVPIGNINTTFMLGKPQSRDIGETLYFDSLTDLTRLEFQVAALTLITPEYHFATEEQKHNLETSAFRGGYKPIEAKINVSLWRDDRNVLGALPKNFDLRVGFTRMEEFDVTAEISVGVTNSIKFPRSIQVTPGYYYLNLYLVIDDLKVTTLRFLGRQTGNNTMGGPNKDMLTNCKYTPTTDLYPEGQAYYSYQDIGWAKKSPTEKWNFQTPRSYTFKLHDYAKVTECIVVGNYNDILNTGDIFFNVYGSGK